MILYRFTFFLFCSKFHVDIVNTILIVTILILVRVSLHLGLHAQKAAWGTASLSHYITTVTFHDLAVGRVTAHHLNGKERNAASCLYDRWKPKSNTKLKFY